MFDNNKFCTILGFITTLIHLIALAFLVYLAKDNAILIVACIAVTIVAAILIGKCVRTLFADGGFFCKIAGGGMVGLFAVGTIVVVAVVLLWF